MTTTEQLKCHPLNAADAWRRPRRMSTDHPIPELLAWVMLAKEKSHVNDAGSRREGLCRVARHGRHRRGCAEAYDDRACLDELGHYLVSTDAFQRFAIWLLHKHFEPAAGEVFAESVITAPRGTQTTPVERCSAQGLTATSMRFEPDVSSGVGVIGMEFADPTEFGSTSPLSPDDETALAGIAERLRAAGKTERFGVRLIRNPLGLAENEVLVETCDLAHRSCTAASVSVTASAAVSKQVGNGNQA